MRRGLGRRRVTTDTFYKYTLLPRRDLLAMPLYEAQVSQFRQVKPPSLFDSPVDRQPCSSTLPYWQCWPPGLLDNKAPVIRHQPNSSSIQIQLEIMALWDILADLVLVACFSVSLQQILRLITTSRTPDVSWLQPAASLRILSESLPTEQDSTARSSSLRSDTSSLPNLPNLSGAPFSRLPMQTVPATWTAFSCAGTALVQHRAIIQGITIRLFWATAEAPRSRSRWTSIPLSLLRELHYGCLWL